MCYATFRIYSKYLHIRVYRANYLDKDQKKTCEYDQEMSQSYIKDDNLMAP